LAFALEDMADHTIIMLGTDEPTLNETQIVWKEFCMGTYKFDASEKYVFNFAAIARSMFEYET